MFGVISDGCQKAMTRLQEDYSQTPGRLWEDDRKIGRALSVSGPFLLETMERFREASAKPPRSLRKATAVQLPCSPLRGPAMSPSPEAQCLSYGLSSPPCMDSTCFHYMRAQTSEILVEASAKLGEATPRSRSLAAKPREANPSTNSGPTKPPA